MTKPVTFQDLPIGGKFRSGRMPGYIWTKAGPDRAICVMPDGFEWRADRLTGIEVVESVTEETPE